jgi:predicted transcriptional regulator
VNDLPLPVIEPDLVPAATNTLEFEPSLDVKVPEAEVLASPAELAVAAEVAVAAELVSTVGKPIAAVMQETLWTVHAEDAIDEVEEFFAAQGLTSAPVVGSNGAIIGMLGAPELAAFLGEGKNPKAVQAWEISRIKTFEVNPTDTVEAVAKLMTDNNVDTIAVTEFGRLKGVVSSQALLQEILNVLPTDASRD